MQRIDKIVVGHDLGAGGEMAARSAAELAKRCGAELKVVHVVDPQAVDRRRSHGSGSRTEEPLETARAQLAALKLEEKYGLTRVDYIALQGKPFVELIRARRSWEADLLVTAGISTADEKRTLGRTAERVAQKAVAPVLIVKKPLTAGTRRFLVPVDFSSTARKAAEAGIALAEKFGAQVRLFHTILLSDFFSAGPGADIEASGPEQVTQPEPLEDEWRAFLSELPGLNKVDWERHTEQGLAAAMIVREAEKSRTDLIVMGTHGSGRSEYTLLGSVTEDVLRNAPCSVLTLRPEGFQFHLP